MSWIARLRSSLNRGRFEQGLDEELALHIEMRTGEYIAEGMTPEEARLRARRRFGNDGLVREKVRDADTFTWLHDLAQDIRYALRTLRKTPGFTAIALLILALGTGANTAMFSAVRAVLLHPLPFRDPDRLVQIVTEVRKSGLQYVWVSHRDSVDWQRQSRQLQDIATYHFSLLNLSDGSNPESLYGVAVSANLFSVLGVSAQVGRTFVAGEDQPGHEREVILSDGLWRRRFGANPAAVGGTVRLSNESFTVVGVMPPGFTFPVRLVNAAVMPSTQMSFWIPMTVEPANDSRSNGFYNAVARLRPGVSLERADSEMSSISAGLERLYPKTNGGFQTRVIGAAENVNGAVRPLLLVLIAATSLVVLTVCANLASLLLARGSARRRDLAVRSALGASFGRLMRQSLTESLLLAVLGSVGGALLARAGLAVFLRFAPRTIPRLEQTRMDGTVLLFAAGLAVVTGILFGLVPAIQAARTSVTQGLREDGPKSSGGVASSRTRSALIVAEVAVALVLAVGAGLLVRSFTRLARVDPGIRPDHLLTSVIVLPQYYEQKEARDEFFRKAVERMRAVPGVLYATATNSLAFAGAANYSQTYRQDRRPASFADSQLYMELDGVTGDYFQTMGIRVLRGREVTREDDERRRPYVVLSESAVRKMWPEWPAGKDPVGSEVCYLDTREVCLQVIGIAADTHLGGLTGTATPTLYMPLSTSPASPNFLMLRTAGPPLALAGALRQEVAALDSNQGVFLTAAMDDMLSDSVVTERFSTMLLTAFGLLGLLLAAAGIYGVVSYSVVRRTQEIGIRMALGATGSDVRGFVVRQGLILAGLGIAIGIPTAFALTHLLSGLLFGTTATDAGVFTAAPALLLLVAIAACVVPAQRAVRVDPAVALRNN